MLRKSHQRFCGLAVLVVLLAGSAAPRRGMCQAAEIIPLNIERFFLVPGAPAGLSWKWKDATAQGPLEYKVVDYWDRDVCSGRAAVTPEGIVETSVSLEPGYYEIVFATSGQRFGVAALPAHEGKQDPFFAIDAAMSWLVGDAQVRAGLVNALQRCGVAMSRERLAWGAISPSPESPDWDGKQGYETLRQTYAAHQVEVLEMFHDAPHGIGRVGKYPADLVATLRQWEHIGHRWQSTWGALEVWNEPDIFFGDNLPADQYAVLVKTVAWTLAHAKIERPVVGGVFAHYNPDYLEGCAGNGLLAAIDALSFHTYARATDMEALVENYRSWLQRHGHESMPLWVTECGRPWPRGPARPTASQDMESALDIVMKAVEARACGVARHFPFVYPYFEENQNNFGMMGREATPLRSMGGYAHLVRCLSHKQYLGDWPPAADAVKRARGFGDDRETVVVLYTGKVDPEAAVPCDLSVSRVEGLDGRSLRVARDGFVPVPDGLAYVWLKGQPPAGRWVTGGRAARLWAASRQAAPRRSPASPFVLRAELDREKMTPETRGYRVRPEAAARVPLRIRVFNLSASAEQIRIERSGQVRAVDGVNVQTVQVPPENSAEVAWQLDLGSALAAAGRTTVHFQATGPGGQPIPPLMMQFIADAEPKPK